MRDFFRLRERESEREREREREKDEEREEYRKLQACTPNVTCKNPFLNLSVIIKMLVGKATTLQYKGSFERLTFKNSLTSLGTLALKISSSPQRIRFLSLMCHSDL